MKIIFSHLHVFPLRQNNIEVTNQHMTDYQNIRISLCITRKPRKTFYLGVMTKQFNTIYCEQTNSHEYLAPI